MPGELAPKFRLVRCPKCQQLLPEFPHYSLYKCGGCGTTLQAKRRKSEAVNSESSSHESDAAPRNSSDLVSEDNECSKGEQLVFPQENVEGTKATISSPEECSLDENSKRDQNENGECNGEQLETFNLSDENMENKMETNTWSDIRINQQVVSTKGCSTELTQCEIEASSAMMGENPVEEENDANLQFAGAEEFNNGSLLLERAEEELNCASDGEDASNDKSSLAGAKSEVDNTGSDSTPKRSSTENFVSEKGSISHITPCNINEGTTSGDNVLSLDEQLKQAQKSIDLRFEPVRSTDNFDASEVIDPSSELSGTLGELSKSPNIRSSHAYDGSVSSFDGMDERIPCYQHLFPLDNINSVADAVSEGRPRRAEGLVNSMIYGDSQTQQHLMNFSSDFPTGKHHFMNDSRGNQNEVLETTRHGYPVQHWMRAEREEFLSKMPFHHRGSQSGYESGSPSNQLHDELYCRSAFFSSDSCEDPDQEKMKLLRMVYELQDQLNRTSYLNGETNGRLSTGVSYKGKHISSYHSHDLHEGRFRHGLDYPMCNGRCSHGINCSQRHKFSRIPYSDEATRSTHHVDLSCFHCHPQEWQCPAELPPHVLCQHEELCRCHPGHNCCSSRHSYPSSPPCFMDTKPPLYGHETKSDDQKHRPHEVKKYFREKQNLAARHVRPVAGGAPFVSCHHCFKLLQLPADFLLFKRVCHQLKCGACSEVLKFSLLNRSHIVSYAPSAIGPSSSELNDQSKVINGSSQSSASHANHYHSSHADPISYSDDYGLSVSKSYSSEGDPVFLTAFHPLHGSEYDPSVSHGTFEPITEKEKIAPRHSSLSETPEETNESAGPSSNMFLSDKVSSETEAHPPPRSSPLHQLMGYSSPSQVVRGTEASRECNLIINEENYVGHGKEL